MAGFQETSFSVSVKMEMNQSFCFCKDPVANNSLLILSMMVCSRILHSIFSKRQHHDKNNLVCPEIELSKLFNKTSILVKTITAKSNPIICRDDPRQKVSFLSLLGIIILSFHKNCHQQQPKAQGPDCWSVKRYLCQSNSNCDPTVFGMNHLKENPRFGLS